MSTERESSASRSLIRILSLAAAYFVAAKLAVLLAVPPGIASPIWPAAGIALAGTLLFGRRVWPGVFAGAFLAGVSGTAAVPLLVAAGIAGGATLQSSVGALLIRRHVGFPHAIDRPADTLKTMVIGGPLSCLISPSIGSLCLLAGGSLGGADLARSLWYWWIGDTLGVLLLLPLLSGWTGTRAETRRRTGVLVAIPLTVGVVVTALLTGDAQRSELAEERSEFERRAEIMGRTLDQRIDAKLDILHSLASFYRGSERVERHEFRAFVEPLLRRHPGLHGLSWNVPVTNAERELYERRAREDGFPEFRIAERGSHGALVPAASRAEYVPVYFIEPYEPNAQALGFDLLSERARAEALRRARDTGKITATPPIELVQETGTQPGFLFFAPIYEHLSTTSAERRTELHSYVSGVFRSEPLVAEALQAFAHEGIGCRIVDRFAPEDSHTIYADSSPPAHGLRWETELSIAGRTWLVEFWPTADYVRAHPIGHSVAVLSGGLFMTSLLCSLVLVLAGRAAVADELQREIEERQRLEEQLLKTQRLESIGLLAGGIAHDFNNLMTAIAGNLSLAKEGTQPGGRYLEAAERALRRSKDLTRQLLTFAKGGQPRKETVELSPLIQESCSFALQGSNVQSDLQLAQELWPASVDAGQIGQVISNLVINAAQAMPQGGKVRIVATNLTVDRDAPSLLEPGRYVELSFEDHGQGIDADDRKRIFDPYFTTKPGGNGLGLATAYSIVRRHGGDITVESELGKGTTFRVYLPASDAPVEPRQAPVELDPPSGAGRVLVMDDEAMIRELARAIVDRLGYEAVLAVDGDDAVERFKNAWEAGDPFDAVVLDLTVPGGTGGKEAVSRMRAIQPDLRAIVSSGYSDDPVLADYREHGFDGAVAKPYTVKEFGSALHHLLDDRVG